MIHPSSPLAPIGLMRRRVGLALVASLFLFIAGSIPLTDSSSGEGLGFVVRAFGIMIGFLILLRTMRNDPFSPPHRWLVILWPAIPLLLYCYASTLWSLDPPATLNRSIETTAIFIFTVYWVRLATFYSDDSHEVASLIAIAILGVTAYGLAINVTIAGTPFRLAATYEESTRLRLIFGYLHPLSGGDILAIGIVAVCASNFPNLMKFGLSASLFWLLVLTDATGARFLVLAICPTLLVFQPRYKHHWAHRGALGLLLVIFAVILTLLLDVRAVSDLLSNQRLWTMTGRTFLWNRILEAGLTDTWFGTGYDGARPAIREVFGIPLQVHNFYLSIPVELGYVGIPFFLLFFVPWLVLVFRYPDPVSLSFVTYVLFISMNTAAVLSKTHLAFAMLLPYCWAIMVPFLSAAARHDKPGLNKPSGGEEMLRTDSFTRPVP